MSVDPVDLIARTLLYEGYLLYPYRPSALKNRQRFTFGVLYPESYSRAHGGGSDAWQLQMECPLLGSPQARLAIEVRFLQLVERQSEDCLGQRLAGSQSSDMYASTPAACRTSPVPVRGWRSSSPTVMRERCNADRRPPIDSAQSNRWFAAM